MAISAIGISASVRISDAATIGEAHDVHIWFSFYKDLNEDQIASCKEMLSFEERRKAQRFVFEADRLRCVVARAMTRSVLANYLRSDPCRCAFELNEFGKPFLLEALQSSPPLLFNVSHTDGLIVLAITRQHDIGVDVESLSVQQAPLEVARDYFIPSEVAQLQSLPPAEQGLRFFEFWTLKEAYIKARGMGLSIPLESFGFVMDGHALRLQLSSSLEGDASSWLFWQMRPTPDHVMALCVKRGGNLPRLHTRMFIPGKAELDISVPILRRSQ